MRIAFPTLEPGTVWLVGAGPGDPGLLTLLGHHALSQADVVVHDALMDEALLNFVRKDAEVIVRVRVITTRAL